MAKNADGELEVLVGNKQLLSLFFIVVILLGVFFTMGYVLGRNSASGSATATAVRKETPATTASGFPNTYSGTDLPSAPTPAPTAPAATPDTPAAVEARPPVHEAVSPVAPTEPVAGQTYLQVVASTRAEVDLVVSVLKRKGFHALTAPGPSADLFRGLVGPLADAAAVAENRAGLEKAGFKPILRKY
jgi:cell division septation protein DedD